MSKFREKAEAQTEQIIGQMALVRLECPALTPKQRLLETKRRCPEAIVPATMAIELAEEKARDGSWLKRKARARELWRGMGAVAAASWAEPRSIAWTPSYQRTYRACAR